MARTYRRVKKRNRHHNNYFTMDAYDDRIIHIYDRKYHSEYWEVTKETPGFEVIYWNRKVLQNNKLWKKEYNKRHRDTHSGEYSPPSWFVNRYCTRPARQHDRAEIKRYLQNEEYEPLFSIYRKTAGWNWW